MNRTRRLPAAAALACLGFVLAGCSISKGKEAAPAVARDQVTSAGEESSNLDSSQAETLAPATKAPLPATSAKPGASASSSSPAVSLSTAPPAAVAAGRVFAFIKSVDVAKRLLTYDQAQFLTGDAAQQAAAQDKQQLDSDYYIRNVNKKLRTVPVAPAATLLGSIALTQKVDLAPVTLAVIAAFASSSQGPAVGFWITVDAKGRITKIEEQYVP